MTDYDDITSGAEETELLMGGATAAAMLDEDRDPRWIGELRPYGMYLIEGQPTESPCVCICPCDRCKDSRRGPSVVRHCRESDCEVRWEGLGNHPIELTWTPSIIELAAGIRAELVRLKDAAERHGAWEAGRELRRSPRDGRSAYNRTVAAAKAMVEVSGARSRQALRVIKVKRRRNLDERADAARYLSTDEIDALWAFIQRRSPDPWGDRLIFWFMLETGCRRGGLIGAQYKQLLVDSCEVVLWEKGAHGSGLRKRTQPISPQLTDALVRLAWERSGNRRPDPSGPLLFMLSRTWTEEPDPAWPDRLKRTVSTGPSRVSRKHIDVLFDSFHSEFAWVRRDRLRPHDVRHTAATWIGRASRLEVAERFLGHSVPTNLGWYTKASKAEVRAAHQAVWAYKLTQTQREAGKWSSGR